jgi:hypothetical protein
MGLNIHLWSIAGSAAFFFVSCADSAKTTNSKRKSSSTDQQNQTSDQNSSNVPVDCESQWSLALRQQPQGAKFIYDSSFSAMIFTDQFERHVSITNSAQNAISQSISVTSEIVTNVVPSLNQQTITLDKAKFIEACQVKIPQPIAISTLGGQLVVKSKSNEMLMLQGQNVQVECIDMDLNNVSYAGYQITANVKMYVSSRYPALPLKQIMTITDSPNLQIIKGASFVDTIKSQLPIAN